MTSKAKIELIVAADEPALFFSSVRSAETYLEAIDVRDGVYTAAYGPEGQPYELEAVADRVCITPLDGPPRPDELRDLLLRCLEYRVEGLESEPLPSLLARCEKHIR